MKRKKTRKVKKTGKPKKKKIVSDDWVETPMSEMPDWVQRFHKQAAKNLNEVARQHALHEQYRKSDWKKKPRGYKGLDDSGI